MKFSDLRVHFWSLPCIFLENNCDEDDNLPSMETLEISNKNPIQSIPSYFGGEEEEDIPDMAEYDEPDNLIEMDPVCCYNSNYFQRPVRIAWNFTAFYFISLG